MNISILFHFRNKYFIKPTHTDWAPIIPGILLVNRDKVMMGKNAGPHIAYILEKQNSQ